MSLSIEKLKDLLSQQKNYINTDGSLNITHLHKIAQECNQTLLDLLIDDDQTRNAFFFKQKSYHVFMRDKFIDFITHKDFLANSYTRYKNKIGLSGTDGFLKKQNDVVLNFPFKDCVLEGGQSKDEEKRNEIYFNQVLAGKEIDQLLSKKVLTKVQKVTQTGSSPLQEFTRDANINEKRNLPANTITDNLIIKGNNLLALHSLKSEFHEKVKLIYIDPPYNTGNDSFHYNDNFNHSTWLLFMKNRLEVAKDLLKEDGVIFVQCDDNEQAYLKVLMDEIFGRENFVNIISVKMKNIAGASGGGEDKKLKKNIEFINIFAKQYNNLNLENTYKYTEIWKLIQLYKQNNISWKYTSIITDCGDKKYLKSTKDGDGNEIKIYKRINPIFKSISKLSQEEDISPKEVYYKYIDKVFTTAMPQSSIRTRVLKSLENETFELISIEYTPRSGRNKGQLYEQFYKGDELRLITWLKDVVEKKEKNIYKKDLQGTFWDGFNLNNLSKEGETVFETGKKPEGLLEYILQIATQEGDIVLDYHLGSATTCAVAHKMGRQYIGIEQMDYVETIAVQRMQKVLQGEQGGISPSVKWQGGGEFVYMELKKYNQAFIEQITQANSTQQLLQIKQDILNKAFIDYRLNIEKIQQSTQDFAKLNLSEQKQILLEFLDQNQLYHNYSEIDDPNSPISPQEIHISHNFYNKTVS